MHNSIYNFRQTELLGYQSVSNLTWSIQSEIPKETLLYEHTIPHQILSAIVHRVKDENKIPRFFEKDLSQLRSPYIIPNMKKSVDRVLYALSNNQHICVCGDDDVDGITGTALLVYFFHALGVNPSYMIPRRSPTGLLFSHNDTKPISSNVDLVITVDFGISSKDECRTLKERGIDVIITDHHIPSDIENIPDVYSIINPQLYYDEGLESEKMLTGAGIAFKLAHAVYSELNTALNYSLPSDLLAKLTDFATLGTIADTGALLEDNRIITSVGIQRLRAGSIHKGLQLLITKSKPPLMDVSDTDLVAKVSAKINSLGRISDAHNGVKLLLSEDPVSIANLLNMIEATNVMRQRLEREMWGAATKLLHEKMRILEKSSCIILSLPNGHPGVASIISTRIMKMYNKVTFIMVPTIDQLIRVSVRSIPSFPLIPLLKRFSHLFITFGGHNSAAGITLHKQHGEDFITLISEAINDAIPSPPQKSIHIDAHLPLSQITPLFIKSLKQMQPFGHNNLSPIFYTQVRIERITNDEKTKKTYLTISEDGVLYQAVYSAEPSVDASPIPSNLHNQQCTIAYSLPSPIDTYEKPVLSIKDIAIFHSIST